MAVDRRSLQLGASGIQLSATQLEAIAATLPAKFLVFGVGNDTPLWLKLNKGARTFFLEHDQRWLDKLRKRCPDLEACLVNYGTRREQWRELLEQSSNLELDLPDSVNNESWDVVLVDGPTGYKDGTPGRMKSIYMASRLARKGGHVFVHDTHRVIEATYSDLYLGDTPAAITPGDAPMRHYIL